MQNRTSGSGLKALREQAGLTQQELSRQTGVSRSLISQWENGVISVSPATRKRVAAFFGVDADTLDSGARQPDAAQQPAQPAQAGLPPRIETGEGARQEIRALTEQYAALNRQLEQMLGRLTEAELAALHESAAGVVQAVETERVFRQVKSFQQSPSPELREKLLRAVDELVGQG